MRKTTLAIATSLIATGVSGMTAAELKRLSAEIITLNGFDCGKILAVQLTEMPDIWQVSCVPDGAMDALVTFRMDARTGLVSGA